MPKGKESTKPTTTRFDAIVAEANYLASLHLPYTNARPPSTKIGFDCSSSCAQLMKAAGYNVPYFNTATAPEYMVKGSDPTGRLTFWNSDYNHTGGDSVHMFATIKGRDWGTGPNGNPGWNEHTHEGFQPYHITGLDEPAEIPINANTEVPGNAGSGAELAGVAATSKAAAISTFLELPGILDSAESEALKGTKSLMNDQPLLPFIEQLVQASLRNFMSMPNGNFYAFIPDYFGGLTKRQPYWEIRDTEVIEGIIYLSDDALATHVYIVGDANADLQVNLIDQLQSVGIVTIANAFEADFISGHDMTKALSEKDKAISFLKKYGARPFYEEAPMIRSHYFEMFLAFQRFCLLWAQQFEAQFEFTFMPELFPGGLVQFPDYGLQMYIQEVNHRGSYTEGFTTKATLIAPSALRKNGRNGVEAGMVRAGVFDL